MSNGHILVYTGELFDHLEPTSELDPLASAEILCPCDPTKIIGIWNNFHEAAEKQGWTKPEEQLYFVKSASSQLAPGGTTVKPQSYDGRVFFEGEPGVVIGRRGRNVSASEVADCVFGYTCVNDVTAFQIVKKYPAFQH